MRKYLIGGNWKCNGTLAFAKSFPVEVLNSLKFDPNKVEVMVAPTALHLLTVKDSITNQNVRVGT